MKDILLVSDNADSEDISKVKLDEMLLDEGGLIDAEENIDEDQLLSDMLADETRMKSTAATKGGFK